MLALVLKEREDKEGSPRINLKGLDRFTLASEEAKNGLRAGITDRQPDNLRWRTMEETELSKVVVLRDDHIGVLPRPFPDRSVCGTSQAKRTDMGAARILRFKSWDEPGA